ncbi:MAG: hypothetical protein LC772_04370 [Chloroflexi bacterium]|nr:hypothetical protein [Chloroflexota bacterium]
MFLNTVDEAIDLALARRPEDGAAELLHGVNRARPFIQSSEPWDPLLLQQYQTALTNDGFRYRVRPEAVDT